MGQEEGRKLSTVGRWKVGSMAAWQDGRMGGWKGGRMEEEGWREEEDKAVYHDSLERVCPKQTPSRSPSPGRRYVIPCAGGFPGATTRDNGVKTKENNFKKWWWYVIKW